MSDSKIEWTDKTWNPITGCSKISPGCARCYAERMAKRLAGRYGYDKDKPFRVTMHGDRLHEPSSWSRPSMIFVCSMGDIFHDNVKWEWLFQVFQMAGMVKRHKYIFLTKRPDRMEKELNGDLGFHLQRQSWCNDWPLPNVWLGVTCENQEQADKRIPILLQIPAAVRFVSVEPMLSPVNILWALRPQLHPDLPCLNWTICGAETGPGKRPMELQWAIDLHEQCEQAGVPYFFKKDSSGNHHPLLPREYPK